MFSVVWQITSLLSTSPLLLSYLKCIDPSANLPRYERIIFLLINGRRTVSDLTQLTKRSVEEVYSTLYRLQGLQLITLKRV